MSKQRYQENLRLRKEDKDLLTQLASRENITKSEYIRNLIRNQQRVFTLSSEEFGVLKKEFAKLSLLGSNLNQISFHMNKGAKQGDLDLGGYVKEISELYLELQDDLSKVRAQIVKLSQNKG